MKNLLLLFGIYLFNLGAHAYNKPNSVIFNSLTRSYLISNLNGHSITLLDSNFKTKDVITGLTRPKDMLAVKFDSQDILLVLDSNEVKVYEYYTFKHLTSYKVNGAKNLEDIELNKNNSKLFYMSDPTANIVFMGIIGSSPNFTLSFSVLNSTIKKPTALLFDSKSRLLVTSDSTKSSIFKMDDSSGDDSLIATTGLALINSLTEDLQGNFYATSWGDHYLYRLDQNFENPVDLALYSHPTGLCFISEFDLIAVTCSDCNKIEFHKLHMVYLNDMDTVTCPGDSFYLHVNKQYRGKGTYNKNNAFMVELTNDQGSRVLASIKTTQEPSSVRLGLPNNIRFNKEKYKVRIKSSDPEFYSINQLDAMFPYTPLVEISRKDTLYSCSENQILLGEMKDEDSAFVNFMWYRDGSLMSHKASYLAVTEQSPHWYKLTEKPKLTGCTLSDSVYLIPLQALKIPIPDSLLVCESRLNTIQADSLPNSDIKWQNTKDSSTFYGYTFDYPGMLPATFLVTVNSQIYGCSNTKFVWVNKKNNPVFESNIPSDSIICSGTPVSILPKLVKGSDTHLKFQWQPNSFINRGDRLGIIYKFTNNITSDIALTLQTTDTITGCTNTLVVPLKNYKSPNKPILKMDGPGQVKLVNYETPTKFQYRLKYKNQNWEEVNYFTNSTLTISASGKQAVYILAQAYNAYCKSELSDTLFFDGLSKTSFYTKKAVFAFPNPVDNLLSFVGLPGSKDITYTIADVLGHELLTGKLNNQNGLETLSLPAGVYSIMLNFEGQYFRTQFIKN